MDNFGKCTKFDILHYHACPIISTEPISDMLHKFVHRSDIFIIKDRKGRLCFQKRLLSVHRGGWADPLDTDPEGLPNPPVGRPPGGSPPGDRPLPRQTPLVVTFSGGRCSGWYACYWNTFLFWMYLMKLRNKARRLVQNLLHDLNGIF